jgi:hypothetical protein
MATPNLTDAERARLAHEALRLREAGIDSDRKIKGIAKLVVVENGQVGQAAMHPLAHIARAVVWAGDADAPGPTDGEGYRERLFDDLALEDVWREWKDRSDANLSENHPDDFAEVTKADELAARKYEESVARMQETGDWPTSIPYGHGRGPDLANALYDLGRQGFLGGLIDGDTAEFKVDLVDSADYVVNLATHEFRSSVAAAGRVATSAALASKTILAGVFDAADLAPLSASVTGDQSEALILFQASAVTGGADVADTAQRLVAYLDAYTGLPVTPNSGPINVTWDSGANRIFKL